jgi:hypothetical protein
MESVHRLIKIVTNVVVQKLSGGLAVECSDGYYCQPRPRSGGDATAHLFKGEKRWT